MPKEMDVTALHRKAAVDCFNGTWACSTSPTYAIAGDEDRTCFFNELKTISK